MIALAAAAVMLVSPASAEPAGLQAASTAAFDCPAPAGWSRRDDEDGTTYLGPRDSNGIAARIGVRYASARADGGAPDADAYVARLTRKPAFDIPGWKTYPPKKLTVAGRAARLVRQDSAEAVPPRRIRMKEAAIREETVVVPAATGYYVIHYYAPRSIAAKNRPAFVKALESFKPKL